MIKELLNHSGKEQVRVTFEINNQGYVYQILDGSNGNYGFERANEGLKRYLSDVKDQLIINFDKESIYPFARIINMGDNFDYLLTDSSNRIYHANFDNGWDPKIRIVANSIHEIIGSVNLDNSNNANVHFPFSQPIYRIKDFIDYSRVVEIDIHGFLIDQYEKLIATLFDEILVKIKLEKFEYEKIDWNDSKITHYPVQLTIDGVVFFCKIEKSKWFDFNLANQLNTILAKLQNEYSTYILHEEDWDEKHAMCMLTPEEAQTLQSKKIIIDN